MKWFSVLAVSLLMWACLIFLASCTSYELKPERKRVFAIVDVVETTKHPQALGTHQFISKHEFLRQINTAEAFSHVEIKKSVYPSCFNHEFGHAFSGDWHKGHNTTHYCD